MIYLGNQQVGLNNSQNNEFVSYIEDQELTDVQKERARNNIGAASQAEFDTLSEDKAPVIINSASGAIASFSDGADGMPVKSLVANIEPVQSGSGDPSPDNVRPITGWTGANVWDDPAYGGNINWNQLVINGNYESESAIYGLNGTLSVIDNVGLVTPNGQYSSTLHYGIRMEMISGGLVTGHKCFIKVDVKSTKADKFRMRVSDPVAWSSSVPANTWTSIAGIITVATNNTLCTIYANDDTLYTTNDKLSFKQCMVIDLTAMFGAGNEPSTVEEFKALFPADYYPYNTGEITTVSAVNGDEYRHYPITFPSEAGTVYGGTLDAATGELVVDRIEWTALRSGWQTYTSSNSKKIRYYNLPSETIDVIPNAITNRFYSVSDTFAYYTNGSTWYYEIPDCQYVYNVSGVSNAKRVWICYEGDDFEDVVEGAKFIFMLQNPQTYTLTVSQITTLLGENHVWADTGDVTVTYNADTKTYVDSKEPEVPVQDVQVNGVSVLENGVANVPIASANALGAVGINAAAGIDINSSTGKLRISNSNSSQVKAGNESYKPITPNHQHESAFYGLAKAAGADMASSSNPVGTYTDVAKKAIRKMLGIPNQEWEKIADYTVAENSDEVIIDTDINGDHFNLSKMSARIFLTANTTGENNYYYIFVIAKNSSDSTMAASAPVGRWATNGVASYNESYSELISGYIRTEMRTSALNPGNSQNISSSSDASTDYTKIIGIKLQKYKSSSSPITAGTRIILYGIRIDE